MELSAYSLTMLIAFSGLFVGKILARFTSEEMAAGKKYFLIMHKAILLAIIVLLLNTFNLNLAVRLISYAIAITALLITKKPKTEAIYPLLGIIFFLSSKTEYFLMISSLIFLYGFPIGSLIEKKYSYAKLILYHALFLVIALGLFFFV